MDTSGLFLFSLFKNIDYFALFRAIAMVAMGWGLASLASVAITRVFAKRISPGNLHITRRLIYYPIFFLFVISALDHLGFELQTLLGAAGIFTIALGFASQTSASNVVSGIFLITERSFNVGDNIVINGVTGKVLSIDWLSTKLVTQENTFIRVPNESIIKSQVTTLSKFATRRMDLKFHVDYLSEFSKVREVFFSIARAEPLSLNSPEPALQILKIDKDGVELQFSCWCHQGTFFEAQTNLLEKIQRQFVEHQIKFFAPMTINMISEEKHV